MNLTKEEVTKLLWLIKTATKGSSVESCIQAISKNQRERALGFFLSIIAGLVFVLAKNRSKTVDEVVDEMLTDMVRNTK